MTQAKPKDKAALLARISAARAALEQALGRLDESALTQPGPDGWSIKDHLAHLSAWVRETTAVLRGQPGHTALGLDAAVYNGGDEDAVNAALQERSHALPLAEVLADFRATHTAILDYIDAESEERLTQPFSPANPEDHRRVIDAIAGNTYEHDEEHWGWIEQRMK